MLMSLYYSIHLSKLTKYEAQSTQELIFRAQPTYEVQMHYLLILSDDNQNVLVMNKVNEWLVTNGKITMRYDFLHLISIQLSSSYSSGNQQSCVVGSIIL
jgi:hypothetical protein